MSSQTNLIIVGMESLRADHMSLYGYPKLTTPHLDRYCRGGTVFENHFSPHIPTTPGYGAMLTGMDCFSTSVVALRHAGGIAEPVRSLPEVLKDAGYESTCVGFRGNPASRGFDNYIDFPGWGSWEDGRSPKAQNMLNVALPELKRLAGAKKPFFLFLRPMDPHSPYLPPGPFERMFYAGDEFDKANTSLDPVYTFKPFCDYFRTWFPPGCTDKDYIIAQYDGAIAYMDACLESLYAAIAELGLQGNTLVVLDSDHGETLYDHDCFFDHHGLYDCTLHVPLAFRMPGKVPAGRRVAGYSTELNIMPTILELMDIRTSIAFDGVSLIAEMNGACRRPDAEFYITECTWMRKHGWRTPQWKLIHALEPDFHFKSQIELYDLLADPGENQNLAAKEPAVVELLEGRMQAWIQLRQKQTQRTAPILTNLSWHGCKGVDGPFTSSQQAYDTLHIGDPETARRLQAKAADLGR